MVFNHSVKLPTQYRKAAKVLNLATTKHKSVRSLVFEEKHAKTSGLMVLMSRYYDNKDAIESAIEKTKLLAENPRLDPYLARVLITELLFGNKKLKAEKAKPVEYVLSFKEKLEEAIVGVASESTARQKRGIVILVRLGLEGG